MGLSLNHLGVKLPLYLTFFRLQNGNNSRHLFSDMNKQILQSKLEESTQKDKKDRDVSAEKSETVKYEIRLHEKYNNQDAENFENYSEEKEEFKQMKNARKQINYSPYSLEDINTSEARAKPDFEEDKVSVEFVYPDSASVVHVYTNPEDSEPVYNVDGSLLLQPEFSGYTEAIPRTDEEQSVWGFIGKCFPGSMR